MDFEWDTEKELVNIQKHQISFEEAKKAFFDEKRLINIDIKHSTEEEKRYFCFGNTDKGIITVRFTIRNSKIRIIGAGLWRDGRKIYEQEN